MDRRIMNKSTNLDLIEESNMDDRYKTLDKLMNKKYGETYEGYGSDKSKEIINRISTDCVSLDRVLGGGIPEGRIIEIFGGASSSKTTICYQIIKSYQEKGLGCFLIDAEHALCPEYAKLCGVNINNLGILKPVTANDALEAIRLVIQSGLVSVVILDSVCSLVPQDEYDKDAGGGMIGSLARLLSQMLKQIVVLADQHKCSVIMINQTRAANITG